MTKLACLPSEDLYHCLGVIPEKNKKLDLSGLLNWGKIFGDDLFFLLTRRRQLLLSTDGVHFKAVGPFKDDQRGHLSTLHYFANILALGFTCGQISIHAIKNPIDIFTMDFETPEVILKAGNDQIIGIDIAPGVEPGTMNLISSCENETYAFVI